MPAVVSFGSVNVDHTAALSADALTTITEQYEWFPAPDETVAVEAVPSELDHHVEATFLGGKGANQAVAAAQAGSTAAFCGKVGTDARKYAVLDTLRDRGVRVDAVGQADCETGKAYVFVTDDGASRIAIVEGANGRVDPAYVTHHQTTIANATCLLLQNEIPIATSVALLDKLAARSVRPTVIFDPAPAAGAAAVLRHEVVDIAVPNEYEATVLRDALAAFEGTIIQTRGPEPITVDPPESPTFECSPPSVTPVDTTGAGDVFTGYLGARLAAGVDLSGAVETAATAAAIATTERGAQRASPTLEQTQSG